MTTIGPEIRATSKSAPPISALTPERRLQLIAATVSTQFDTILSAAKGCDLIVGATALQVAAPSVAEYPADTLCDPSRRYRSLGLRAIVSSGWADLTCANGAPDRLGIGEVNHQALFKRVAAVVHHGGAGTTTAAARAGVPQVVIPQMYDQFYWAQRVAELAVGVSLSTEAQTGQKRSEKGA